jgi:hypothetical protein
MPQLRVLLGFATASDSALMERGQAVHDNFFTSPVWAVPPNAARPAALSAEILFTNLANFGQAIAAASVGGPADTADKNSKRDVLISQLRQLAGYVQDNHDNALAKLLASGFEAVSTNRASAPLGKPKIVDILNGNSGQLVVRIGPITNAKCYELRYALIPPNGVPGPWQNGGLFTNSRALSANALTPGGNYQFQARAIGGSTGYSDWSDPVSHMSL